MRQSARKPLSWAKTEQNIRISTGSEEELRRLAQSYKKRPIHPLIARADGTMIDGTRRVLGLRLIGETEAEFLITDEELTHGQILEIQLESALHRQGLSGYEQFHGYAAWLRQNPGATAKELAERMKLDAGHLSRVLSLSKCIPVVQEAAEAGRIGVSDWYAMSKVPPQEQHTLLAMKLSGAIKGREALESTGRKARNGHVPAVRIPKIAIPIGGARLVLSGKDLDMSAVVALLADCLKEARKAAEQFDIRTWERMMKDKSKGNGQL